MSTSFAPSNTAVSRCFSAYAATEPSLDHYVHALDHVKQGGDPHADLVGKAAKALTSVNIRDAVVVAMALAPAIPDPDDLRNGPSPELADVAMNRIVSPERGVRPGTTVDTQQRLLETISAYLPDDHQAPAATLLALIAWWRDESCTAVAHLNVAIKADPYYNLAHLLAATITVCPRPGWTHHP